ncbi:PIN domain-like protein [Lactarius psammicola]|nr:PIN domain-like protein [Lactarius psammicola]
MGVTGLWDIIRPSGKLRSLTHIAVVDGFVANPADLHGFRIGIDASIWFFHVAHGREGENPELRTLFFRCAKLMSAPFLPLFIFDGPKRPKVKRGKRVSGGKHWLVDSMKGIIEAFGFEWRMAPGEAEAELAHLNSIGIIDAVLSDDVDNFLFGAKVVIRNPSANLSGNSKHAMKNADGRVDGNHSTVYNSADILAHPSVQLTRGGLILIGLLSGGDYHPAGLALLVAQSLTRDELPDFLTTWREDLRRELRTNSRGHLGSKKPSLAKAVPDEFPDIEVLLLYTNPIISATDAGARCTHTPPRWEREPDLGKLAHVCELHFEWGLKDVIIKRFRTILWPSIVLRALRRSALEAASTAAAAAPKSRAVPGVTERAPLQDVFGTPSKLLARHFSSMGFGAHDSGDGDGGGLQDLIVKIHSSRMHAYTDSILEYRLEVAPAQLVHLACVGIQGLRKPADTTYDVLPSEREKSGGDPDNRETRKRKKRRSAGPPPEPDSHLRMWMPACMIRPALPDVIGKYEAELEAKHVKNLSKDKQQAPAMKAPSKRKAPQQEILDVITSDDDKDDEAARTPPPTASPPARKRPTL